MTAPEPADPLGTFIRFADQIQAAHAAAHRPAYAETCTCGASVEVAQTVAPAELRRIRTWFQNRHRQCLQHVDGAPPLQPVLGQVGDTDA